MAACHGAGKQWPKHQRRKESPMCLFFYLPVSHSRWAMEGGLVLQIAKEIFLVWGRMGIQGWVGEKIGA